MHLASPTTDDDDDDNIIKTWPCGSRIASSQSKKNKRFFAKIESSSNFASRSMATFRYSKNASKSSTEIHK